MKMAELLPLKVYTFEFLADFTKFWPRGYKTFFMLNSVELSFLLINVKMLMLTTVGILRFMSRKNSVLSLSEPAKC